ncbi:MAG: energy-coupling factor ABC transporter ATP-binding protein [Deltaproteobacteria bacterium]|nr:energy-coupling factor ABC transporter ATP-binding protein [Deltaproteobacteria bacterium]
MLEAVDISHTFCAGTPFKRQVLRGIQFKLAPGEVVLLTGPSGSGKTTLARILSGLVKPTQGTMRFNGMDLNVIGSRPWPVSDRIVLASQYPERQFFANTVWDELSWGLRVGLGLDRAEIADRLRLIAGDLGFPLEELAKRSPRSLSSGQQRKAALASLLALEPQVLILDEPLAGLNAKEGQRLISLLQNWHSQSRSMLIIAHELELFFDWVEKVAVMDQGQMVFFGSLDELCQSSDPTARDAAFLPVMVQFSFFLKQNGLSPGPITSDGPLVLRQLQEALTKKRGIFLHTRKIEPSVS